MNWVKSTRRCYIQNIKVQGHVVSDKNILVISLSKYTDRWDGAISITWAII